MADIVRFSQQYTLLLAITAQLRLRVCGISRAISDQKKRRTFATLGQVAHGAVAAPAAPSRLGARKKASHRVHSEKWPVHRR